LRKAPINFIMSVRPSVRILYEDICKFMITSRSLFLITRNVLRERFRENQNRVGMLQRTMPQWMNATTNSFYQ